MDGKVSLRAVVEELVSLPVDYVAYLDLHTGAIFSFSDDDLRVADADRAAKGLSEYPEWQREVILKAREVGTSERFVALPISSEINETQIMEKFCEQVRPASARREIEQTTRTQMGFRRFKEVVRRHGLEQEWFDFEYSEMEGLATQWLEARQIPYLRDLEIHRAEEA